MATAKLLLKELIQDSQDYGSNDEHMVSRVFFDLELDDKKFEGLYADIKQPVGGSFDTSQLEVSRPANYEGPFNYEAFRDIVEKYYRSLIGSVGSVLRIAGAGNVRMRNNKIVKLLNAEFEVKAAGGPW